MDDKDFRVLPERVLPEPVRPVVDPRAREVAPQPAGPAENLDAVDRLLREAHARDVHQDVDLKRRYARAALLIVVGQLAVADLVMVAYVIGLGRTGDIDGTILHSFLAATVVETIGIMLVITRYLFPNRDRPPAEP